MLTQKKKRSYKCLNLSGKKKKNLKVYGKIKHLKLKNHDFHLDILFKFKYK